MGWRREGERMDGRARCRAPERNRAARLVISRNLSPQTPMKNRIIADM